MQLPLSANIIRPSGKDPVSLGSGIITKLLGDGGMASVYEIWNSQLEVYRAVKLLHPNCSRESLDRFQTEIKITAKFHHPYIIEIHAVGEWNGLPYIEMEKVDGATLEQLIYIRGAFPIEVVVAIGIMVSKALEYAHNHEYVLYNKSYHGIIHRDLKPGNIMVCNDGCVKLMDFGIARPTDTSFHTIDGTVIGTLQYLSPEQLEGRELDIKTDIHSLGICLYEMACGTLAFPENNISRLLSDKTKNKYKPLNDYDVKLPHKLIELIHQCMTHDKTRRPQDATVLYNELMKVYSKLSNEKPEITVANYLAILSDKRNKPSLHSGRSKDSKLSIFIILISIFLLCIMLVASRKQSQKSNISTIASSQKTAIIQSNPHSSTESVNPIAVNLPSSEPKKSGDDNTIRKVHSSNSKVAKAGKKELPQEEKSSIDDLIARYDTNDWLLIAQKEILNNKPSNALQILNRYRDDKSQFAKIQVLKARALEKIDIKMFESFVLSMNINEAELLLYKSMILIEKGSYSEAGEILDRASTAPKVIISPEIVTAKVYYYKAICASKRFDMKPDEKHWKEALGAWYIVKKEMRTQPMHDFFKKADEEIVRIGAKYRAAKG